jgi:hypothetical protein
MRRPTGSLPILLQLLSRQASLDGGYDYIKGERAFLPFPSVERSLARTKRTMSNHSDQFRPATERKLALSSLIHRTMATVAEREQQRSKLVSVLILAQFLVTAMTTAGYLGSATMIPSMLLGGAALIVYCCAYTTNRFFHRSWLASYILIIGGALCIAGQTLILALNSQPLQAGQVSLLFVAIILEAGLLFSPEVTLLTGFSTTVFAAFAILLGLSNNHTVQRSDAYFSVAFTLGLQALATLIAWLLAQFIFETSLEAHRAQDLQFAQARLDALSNQTSDHQRLLDESVGELLQTISRVMSGDYMVRAEIPESELAPLADSLNLLFQRYEDASAAERVRSRMDAAALPMIDTISRMSDSSTPTPTSLPIMTNTPLDSVSVVLRQMQTNLNNRMGRVQRLAGEVVSTLNHSQEPLTGTLDAVHEAQRIAGALIASAETMLNTTRRQLAQIFTVRRMLSVLLPDEITRVSENNPPRATTGELTGLAQDLGMGSSGYTGQFEAVPSSSSGLPGDDEGGDQTGIAPLTLPLATISSFSSDEGGNESGVIGAPAATGVESGGVSAAGQSQVVGYTSESSRKGPAAVGDIPVELVETWNLISQIDKEVAEIERVLGKLESQIGVQSKQLRTADANIAWFRSALDAVRSNAEQLQQIAGTPIQMPGADSSIPPASPSRPLPQGPYARDSQPSRPLSDDPRPVDPGEPVSSSGPTAGPISPEESMHAPGSLRASDLLSFDDIDFTSLENGTPESDGGSLQADNYGDSN